MLKKIKKTICVFFATIFIFMLFGMLSFAENSSEKNDYPLAISNRSYSGATTKEISDDFVIGADMVSISLFEKDGRFFLEGSDCDESSSLGMALWFCPEDNGRCLILDYNWDDESARIIADTYPESNKIILRGGKIKDSSLKRSIRYIDTYSGGVVFSALSKIKNNENGFVRFQSKNYFNPFYRNIVTKNFEKNNVVAIAPTFDPDLCGRREDNATCWDELISKGFNAIETNNINSFVAYKNDLKKQRKTLEKTISECNGICESDSLFFEKYSQKSADNFMKAFKAAKASKEKLCSLSRLQKLNSNLIRARNNLSLKRDNDTTRGALNITLGKIIASILCGAGLLGFEFFLVKKRRKNI